MIKLYIVFEDKKSRRKANWLVKNFATMKAFEHPQSSEDYIALIKERGLNKQYQGSHNKTIFPTEEGWKYFREFVELLESASPFSFKASYSDVFNAFATALADIASSGLLPESIDDFLNYLPSQFIESMNRYENHFHKLEGVVLEDDFFVRIGKTWIGNFRDISFSHVQGEQGPITDQHLTSVNEVFKDTTVVISGGRITGTGNRIKSEDTIRTELGVGVLALMLNMTYENVFSRLSNIQRIERFEQGLSKQLSFGLSGHLDKTAQCHLTLSMRGKDQDFNINEEIVQYWHEAFLLCELNKIIEMDPSSRSELHEKLIKALLYFRQASLQATLEMQMSTLWVCVESLLTVDDEGILETNLPTLLAISEWSLPRELWPGAVDNLDQLTAIFKRYYRIRSRTFHHGSTGHVTDLDVQQFSVVVCHLVVTVSELTMRGFTTTRMMLRASKNFLIQAEYVDDKGGDPSTLENDI